MDILCYVLVINILLLSSKKLCTAVAEKVNDTSTSSNVSSQPTSSATTDTGQDAMYISISILIIAAVAVAAFLAIWILRKRQVANIQHNNKTKRPEKVYWRVYDAVEKKPLDFMRLKAGARARLVDMPKASTNHYSEIRLSTTQPVIPSESWYSSVYIDIPPKEETISDTHYDIINLNKSFNKTIPVNQRRPAYDHVIAEDVLNSVPRKDGYSHMNTSKTENSKTNKFKVVEDKIPIEDHHRKDQSAVCEKEDHEYYILDPDGNLYIVHECNNTR